jgi:hypothetical protein
MLKYNKYVVKATVQVAASIAVGVVAAVALTVALNYFNPTVTQLLVTIASVVLIYALYNLILIRASILQSLDEITSKIK